jgi:hypothetical protein
MEDAFNVLCAGIAVVEYAVPHRFFAPVEMSSQERPMRLSKALLRRSYSNL